MSHKQLEEFTFMTEMRFYKREGRRKTLCEIETLMEIYFNDH